jgi:DNA polymerase V
MIALVDCNNFYASCERLFNPALKGKPIVVLSNNDGCVIARSEEAKDLGIEMGAPAFEFEEFFAANKVQVYSSNYTLYGSLSHRVMQTLGSFTPEIEVYSIDEAFLNMNELPYENLLKLGVKIRRTIKQHIGLPVSIGIAPTKTLAKMANRYAKKNRKTIGVHWAVNQELIQEMLEFTAVQDIWGIGRQHSILLKKNGYNTAADLVKAPDHWVRKHLTVVGLRMLNELRGIPSIDWETAQPAKKNIMTSRSFGKIITNKEDMVEALANYAALCADKLREQKSVAQRIHVFVNTNQHRTGDKQYYRSVNLHFPEATNYTPTIISYALKGLNIIYTQGYNYHKVGVMVLDIIPESVIQAAMFTNINQPNNKKIMQVLDAVNGTMGKETVRFAIQGFEKRYRLRAEYRSQHYTTNINQILTINA